MYIKISDIKIWHAQRKFENDNVLLCDYIIKYNTDF